MSGKMVAVPVAELKKLEQARQALWNLLETRGLTDDLDFCIGMRTLVTDQMWHLANRRWEEVYFCKTIRRTEESFTEDQE